MKAKLFPKGKTFSSVLFKKRTNKAIFYLEFTDFSQSFPDNISQLSWWWFLWKLLEEIATVSLPSVCFLNPFASKSSFLRLQLNFIPLQFVCFHNLCWQQKDKICLLFTTLPISVEREPESCYVQASVLGLWWTCCQKIWSYFTGTN